MDDSVLHELKNANISLVKIINGTPHCVEHGAMNKISKDGIWRCLTLAYIGKNGQLFENRCRAGANYER